MEMLYHQYKRRVFGMAHRIVGASDAEEVAQEVFVRVFRGLANVPRRLGAVDLDLPADRQRVAVAPRAARPPPGGRRRGAGRACRRRRSPSAIRASPRGSRPRSRELPAGYRAILVLHDVEGLSHEECAAILECRVGTCKSQLHKARARMRDLLAPIGGAT